MSNFRNKNFVMRDSIMQNIPLSQQILAPTFPEKIEKPHVFKLCTFKGLNWCELCGNFLWGFTFQGKKCDDCGVIAHGRYFYVFVKWGCWTSKMGTGNGLLRWVFIVLTCFIGLIGSNLYVYIILLIESTFRNFYFINFPLCFIG